MHTFAVSITLLHSHGFMVSLLFSFNINYFQKIRDQKYKDCLYILIHHWCLDDVTIIFLLSLRSESLLGWMWWTEALAWPPPLSSLFFSVSRFSIFCPTTPFMHWLYSCCLLMGAWWKWNEILPLHVTPVIIFWPITGIFAMLQQKSDLHGPAGTGISYHLICLVVHGTLHIIQCIFFSWYVFPKKWFWTPGYWYFDIDSILIERWAVIYCDAEI